MAITVNTKGVSNTFLNQSLSDKKEKDEELASAKRINEAKDDPAGLQISSRLTSQLNELGKLSEGFQDNINYNQVLDGQISSVNESLFRAQELSIQSANGAYSEASDAIQAELDAITEEVNVIVENATGQTDFLTGLDATDPITTQQILEQALIDTTTAASSLGAESNALQARVNVNQNSYESLSSSRSRIVDTDYASTTSAQEQEETKIQTSVQIKKENEERKGVLINSLI
jgi:flagellin